MGEGADRSDPAGWSQDQLPLLVLCVPGPWADRRALVTAIAGRSDGFLSAGQLIMNTATGRAAELDVQPPDERLADAFRAAGGGRLGDDRLDVIARHAMVPYLVGRGGSPGLAREMADFAVALLRAGGVAVKVESAGVARPAGQWMELTARGDPYALQQAYTAYVTEPGRVRSCGMHNLGLRECEVIGGDPDEAFDVAQRFLRYVCEESPTIVDGQTLGVAAGAPAYRISTGQCRDHPPEDLFHNPFGVWTLRRA